MEVWVDMWVEAWAGPSERVVVVGLHLAAAGSHHRYCDAQAGHTAPCRAQRPRSSESRDIGCHAGCPGGHRFTTTRLATCCSASLPLLGRSSVTVCCSQVDGIISAQDFVAPRPSLFSRSGDAPIQAVYRGQLGAITHYFPTRQCVSLACRV